MCMAERMTTEKGRGKTVADGGHFVGRAREHEAPGTSVWLVGQCP